MRLMFKFSFPVEQFNPVIRDGSVGQKFSSILGDIKPEAVYFTAVNGNRGCYLVVNVEDPSQIPSIADPFLLSFNASMEWIPVFGPEDLEKASEGLDEVIRKYG